MLFNSYVFLFAFLPVTLLGFAVAAKGGPSIAVAWLLACSLVFYAYWNPLFLFLIIGSIAVNYTAGRLLAATQNAGKSAIFVCSVAINLLLLGAFKYLAPSLHFLMRQGLVGTWSDFDIILPLGISFFTFTQIGYLVDRRDNLAEDLGALRYGLFVTFFPHLIAGPIIHVREIGPQLLAPETYKLRIDRVVPGFALFVIGLSKKVLLADPLSLIVAPGFSHPAALTFVTAWTTALAYAAQLYFDFSGYSDMAIGLAGMFGFRFPINFNSPLRARSIIEFWQNWHITLSRYLRLLLYNPLAVAVTRYRLARGLKTSQKALASPFAFAAMVALPTFFTMALAGIWHGAGIQFFVFGLLHAAYLTVNQAWRVFRARARHGATPESESRFSVVWQVLLTQTAVLVSFVFFRSDSCTTALHFLAGMIGAHGISLPDQLAPDLVRLGGIGRFLIAHILAPDTLAIAKPENLLRILASFAIIWLAPNSQQIMGKFAAVIDEVHGRAPALLQWRPNFAWALITAIMLWASVTSLRQSTEFLYFQF